MNTTQVTDNKLCPMSEASKLIGDFWNILIVRELLSGCKRFNELQEKVEHITNSTLSDRLKNLVDEGIIERKQYECIPPKVEYTLTEKGRGLKEVIDTIEQYSKKWL